MDVPVNFCLDILRYTLEKVRTKKIVIACVSWTEKATVTSC